jgi:hypothetical protein
MKLSLNLTSATIGGLVRPSSSKFDENVNLRTARRARPSAEHFLPLKALAAVQLLRFVSIPLFTSYFGSSGMYAAECWLSSSSSI